MIDVTTDDDSVGWPINTLAIETWSRFRLSQGPFLTLAGAGMGPSLNPSEIPEPPSISTISDTIFQNSSAACARRCTPLVSSASIYSLYIRKSEKVPLEEETAVPGDPLCTDVEDNGRRWAVRPHPSNEGGTTWLLQRPKGLGQRVSSDGHNVDASLLCGRGSDPADRKARGSGQTLNV